jgi:hypothetical protein
VKGGLRDADCLRARRAIHRRLDGEPVAAPADHLAGCSDCRALAVDLETIRTALRSVAARQVLDGAALEQVWARTTLAELRAAPGRGRGRRGALLVAAALLAAAFGLWLLRPAVPAEPSRAELERAAAQTRLVLGLTARALERTRRAAVGGVLGGEVSPALRRVPIDWPAAPVPQEGRSRT